MKDIKLQYSMTMAGDTSYIEPTNPLLDAGPFAAVINDPKGVRARRLSKCWNEYDELVKQRDELLAALEELHALVWGECSSLLNEDSGGLGRLDVQICRLLAKPKGGEK